MSEIQQYKSKVDYKQGKIYRLWRLDSDMIYIGSTTTILSHRLSQHKQDFKRYTDNKKVYITSFKLFELGIDDVRIELVESFPCDTKEELMKREGFYIRKYKHCVNKVIVGRTDKEYYEENKKTISEKNREYRIRNSEVIQKRKRDYLERNRSEINIKQRLHYHNNKDEYAEKNKLYRMNNTDVLKQKSKEYRDKNRDEINQKKSLKFDCACGGVYTNGHKSRHMKSQKHQNWLNQPKPIIEFTD